jgi:hypothetical protein
MSAVVEAFRGALADCAFLVLTPQIELARAALGRTAKWAKIVEVPPAQVAPILGACDIGFSLRTPTLAMSGVAPIKLGEYLLSGLPVIGTPGIGQTKAAEDAGVFIDAGLNLEVLISKVQGILETPDASRAIAREVGLAHFSLSAAISDYAEAVAAVRKISTRRGA